MEFDMSNFQALAENLVVEGEVCDLAHAKLSTQPETDTEIAPLIQQVAATSIAEIDRLIAELQEAKNYLQSEGERIERRTAPGSPSSSRLFSFAMEPASSPGWQQSCATLPSASRRCVH